MFTGIVEEVGTVKASDECRLTIGAKRVLEGTKIGDSISVNGACLTVVSLSGDIFSVDVMPETLRRTNLGRLQRGDPVNLERALAIGDRLGGHFVQGHVEGTGRVLSYVPERDAIIARFSAPPTLMRYIVPKGFIAVDGISLTVVDCQESTFSVSLVAFTQQNTNLTNKHPGDLVNLETDIIAKYVEKLQQGSGGVTLDFLAEHGFTRS